MAGKYEKPTETIKLRGCSHDPVCWECVETGMILMC
jgi:hypothetical protein